ncbi:XRE family transcriptional regulator [Streptococcus suis]|uniref:XRE family transcriptional regulator n=1 Tax=Streptococcus suis TaxID=1307 RepID=UPI00211BD72F|nr:XRE family transcriptional regulator [Streptococcus suis]UUM48654.1 XRE family transcriptional regulator [Streptococcus suis]HEM2639559.1 helix-turn-helix transcriptional regulator [Streptococcus suis]
MDEKKRMQIIAENITYYRKQRGITQKELAKEVGITPSTMTDYMKLRSAPSFGVIQKLADFFGIKKSDIDTTFKEEKSTIPSSTPQTVSDDVLRLDRDLHSDNHKSWIRYGNVLLDKQNTVTYSKNTVNELQAVYFTYNYYDQPASAGTGQYLNDVQVEQIELPVNVNADFVVPIYGDSMEPEYHSGDYIFVKLSVDLSDGDIGVFAYNGDAYIKQLRITDQGAYLHSLNPDYDNIPITADTDFRTIGEVVEVYRG